MKYISTRGLSEPHSFSEAVATGLAPDGGLFIPEILPDISAHLKAWETLSYPALCAEFFKLFATDIEPATIERLAFRAYQTFDHPEIAPLKNLDEDLYVLELFHGPTLAFKDFALQFLGNLYEYQISQSGKKLNVLGATSGDTGAAAIHGLLGKEGVNIFILYPDGRVSPLQERQMTCTDADNVYPLAIEGSFDDAQKALKETFEDLEFRQTYALSAVNSINLARILAQCVYYIHAWLKLPADRRNAVEFIVPTGNFGNILAGWLARKMGLPVKSLTIATNQNDILYRLFTSGIYETGTVQPSHAPSMDIQVASNFERFLYFALDKNTEQLRQVMQQFRETGRVKFENFDTSSFLATRADDTEIINLIGQVYEKYGYIIDPHTACGFAEQINRSSQSSARIILSTAHPAKFPETITRATGIVPTAPALEKLKSRTIRKFNIPATRDSIKSFIQEHASR